MNSGSNGIHLGKIGAKRKINWVNSAPKLQTFFVKQNNSEGFAAIGFNLAHKKEVVANRKPFQMAYCLDENEWNGQLTLQLRLKDIQ